MARTEKRAREKIGSSSYFLRCFGFSRKIYSDKPMAPAEYGVEKKMKKNKKPSRWFLCSKFRLKNGEIKPAPIEETEKPTSSVEGETDKQTSVPVISRITDRKNIPADDKAVNQETKERKPKDLRDITTDRPIEPLCSSREDTCLNRISNSTRHGKPEMKPSRAKTRSRVEKFDPVIGISIIILTLMIMLIWGRLCAILCTSAWCYLLPRLKDAAALAKRKRSSSDGSAYVPDLNSESYKRKVVLEGFLGRQNRVSFL
ncbi:hypothetical protein EUTSA_v10014452mg [Eutrema salsugineum]|uniref:Uncharacterized protein n=1 Tax=Eutrema salsugineum TaxID=72664 RepID=V4LLR7_EUTSA|nr:uncharacterized protein At5g23160 [Eutrema salsugineum]ESQ40763.1 hypothetical protein EUTSA_v10014452mg [Eutrema salsugineum]